jgi:hypothetical protein
MSSVLTAGPESLPTLEVASRFSAFSGPFIAFWALVLILGLRGLLLVLPDKIMGERLQRLQGIFGVLTVMFTVLFLIVLVAYAYRVL